ASRNSSNPSHDPAVYLSKGPTRREGRGVNDRSESQSPQRNRLHRSSRHRSEDSGRSFHSSAARSGGRSSGHTPPYKRQRHYHRRRATDEHPGAHRKRVRRSFDNHG